MLRHGHRHFRHFLPARLAAAYRRCSNKRRPVPQNQQNGCPFKQLSRALEAQYDERKVMPIVAGSAVRWHACCSQPMRLAAVTAKVHLKLNDHGGPGRNGEPRRLSVRAPSEPVKSGSIDIEEFAKNIARMVEEGGKALAAYLKPREDGRVDDQHAELTDVVKTLGQVAEYWLTDPQRTLELQSSLGKAYLDLWAHAVKRMAGEPVTPVAAARSARQALRRSGMVEQPVLRFPQAGLSADRRSGRRAWSTTPKGSTRTPGTRPSSTCARSPTRSRPRTSC